ncbi:hypothetical protein Ancab_000779 [Ancistrocladus abbreviatus]
MSRSSSSPTAATGAAADNTTPLLSTSPDQSISTRSRRFSRTPRLQGAARFLRHASSRQLMREPFVRVPETTTEQIEERQSDNQSVLAAVDSLEPPDFKPFVRVCETTANQIEERQSGLTRNRGGVIRISSSGSEGGEFVEFAPERREDEDN